MHFLLPSFYDALYWRLYYAPLCRVFTNWVTINQLHAWTIQMHIFFYSLYCDLTSLISQKITQVIHLSYGSKFSWDTFVNFGNALICISWKYWPLKFSSVLRPCTCSPVMNISRQFQRVPYHHPNGIAVLFYHNFYYVANHGKSEYHI